MRTSIAYARAGLVGNPSDGYFGKTIAFSFREFVCHVTLTPSTALRIEPHHSDRTEFSSVDELIGDVKLTGYYGGVRLIKAAIVRFARYLREVGAPPIRNNFTVRYETSIPQRVGLAGSSAIITAMFRALAAWSEVRISRPRLANLVLETETQELGIPAGLQDRVAQAYDGLVYMDFDRAHMTDYGYGRYRRLDPAPLKRLYVAYRDRAAEGTEVPHSRLRERFERGDRQVRHAMREFARLTDAFRHALVAGDHERMHALINRNFDLRAAIVPISGANWELVNTARNIGASAKFAGSGGAIVGFYADEAMYDQLAAAMERLGAGILRPTLTASRPAAPGEEDGA